MIFFAQYMWAENNNTCYLLCSDAEFPRGLGWPWLPHEGDRRGALRWPQWSDVIVVGWRHQTTQEGSRSRGRGTDWPPRQLSQHWGQSPCVSHQHTVRVCSLVRNGEHGVVVRDHVLYWGGNRFESLNSPLLVLKQVLHPSLVVVVNNKKIPIWQRKAKWKEQWWAVGALWPWASQFATTALSRTTIGWPLGCKYGTIACYGEIVSEKAPT